MSTRTRRQPRPHYEAPATVEVYRSACGTVTVERHAPGDFSLHFQGQLAGFFTSQAAAEVAGGRLIFEAAEQAMPAVRRPTVEPVICAGCAIAHLYQDELARGVCDACADGTNAAAAAELAALHGPAETECAGCGFSFTPDPDGANTIKHYGKDGPDGPKVLEATDYVCDDCQAAPLVAALASVAA